MKNESCLFRRIFKSILAPAVLAGIFLLFTGINSVTAMASEEAIQPDGEGQYVIDQDTSAEVVNAAQAINDSIVVAKDCEVTVTGNLEIVKDFTLLENSKLHVTGNFDVRNRFLGLRTGSVLTVDGDMIFSTYGWIAENSEAASVTVVGNLKYLSSSNSPSYVAGNNPYTNRALWSIGGDIIQGENSGQVGFNNIKLTGTSGEQTISLNSNSYIHNLSTSGAKVVVSSYLNGPALQNDMTFKPGTNHRFKGINLNGHSITVEGDMLNEDDVKLSDGSILSVTGNYTQANGELYLNTNSVMNVPGNITFSGTSRLNGSSASTIVNLDGDFIYATASNSPAYVAGNSRDNNRGKWIIKGSISQTETSGSIGFNNLVLAGDGEQQISLINPESYIELLTTEDTVTDVAVTGYLCGTTSNNDMTIKPAEGMEFRGITTGDHHIVIDGNMLATNQVIISNDGELEVRGNYKQTSNYFSLNSNSVFKVTGNAEFSGTSLISGSLASSRADIGGNFIYTTAIESPTYVRGNATDNNRGVWSIAGNITQNETSGNVGFNNVVLSGSGEQILSLNPGSYIFSLTANEGVTAIVNNGCLRSTTFNGNTLLKNNGVLNGVKFGGDFVVEPGAGSSFSGINLNGHVITVDGDMNSADGTLNVENNSTLNVNGNLYIKKGYLTMGSTAKLNVTGKVLISETGSIGATHETAKAVVGNDFEYTSSSATPVYNNSNNAAVWSVSGNVVQAEDVGSLKFSNLKLTGTDKQILTLRSNSSVYSLAVGDNNPKVVLNGYLKNTTFNSDMNIEAAAGTEYSNLNINGHTVTLSGNMLFTEGTLNIADRSTLNINGKLDVNNGYLTMGAAAKLNVTDDVAISGTGSIGGSSETAKANVGKDFLYTSVIATPGYNGSSNSAKWTVNGNLQQDEEVGTLNFELLQMNTKGSSVILPGGKINKLVLIGKKSDFTLTPKDCYNTLEEKKQGDDPKPDDPKPDDPKPATVQIEGGDGATDTQPEIDNETTELTLVKDQKFVLADKDWKSSAPGIVTVSKGNVTAKKAGNANLTRKDRSIEITVIAPYIDNADKTLKLLAGEKGKLNLKGAGSLDILYSSAAPDIASVDEEGNVTAISKGNAAITAYVNGVAFKFTVKVTDANTLKRDFTKEVSLVPNQSMPIKIKGFKANKAVWSSDTQVSEPPAGFIFKDDVVKINKAGKITAIGSGSTTLTGKDNGGSSVTIKVTVSDPAEQIIHLNVGKSRALKLYGIKGNPDWTGTDTAVMVKGNKFIALNAGTATFTAKYENFTYKATVIVEDPKITDSSFAGKPYSYTIYMKVGDEESIVFNNVIQDVTFISNKNAVVYCDPNLKIHARSKGTAKLTARINGTNVTVKVIVN